MADIDNLSKKQIKELRKLAELEKENQQQKQNTFKWIAIGISSIVFVVLFVGMIIMAKQQNTVEQSQPVKLSNTGWVRGKADAKITLAEFSDLQCPACRFYAEPVKQVLASYPDDVRLQFKHFPLTSAHKNAMAAAIATEAAGEQNKFWEMHDILFDKQGEWEALPDPSDKFLAYAEVLKLDIPTFKKALLNEEVKKKVTTMQNEGIKLGVNSTPTFFLNGKKIKSPGTVEEFKKLIDAELAK